MPEFYLLLATNSDMSPRSSMPEFYLLLATNSDMSQRSFMSEFYLILLATNLLSDTFFGMDLAFFVAPPGDIFMALIF